MSTPTPGDLSARLREVLSFYANKANYDSPESNCGNYYLASEADKDKGEKAREAIAALSALPAAGGLDFWALERACSACYGGGVWAGMTPDDKRAARERLKAATTPQPSAAEGVKGEVVCNACGYPEWVCDAIACGKIKQGSTFVADESTDAAVGAQGEAVAKVVRVTPMGPIVEWYDNQPVGTELFAHAAPAAGKGVDEVAFWRETYRQHIEAEASRAGYPTTAAKCFAHNAILEVEGRIANAALTRQPVARDGMVLVPRERLEFAQAVLAQRVLVSNSLPPSENALSILSEILDSIKER